MAQQQEQATTMKMLETARGEVDQMKEHLRRLMSQDVLQGENAAQAQAMLKNTMQLSAMLDKSENSMKRMKNARVPPRPTASIPEFKRAERALSILLGESPASKASSTDTTSPDRNKPRQPAVQFVTIAEGRQFTPLREDALQGVVQRAAALSKLNIAVVKPRGVGFECAHIFRAFLWFADGPSDPSEGLVPEHMSVFGMDEMDAGRWSSSKHAVFGVLTERANAAVRFFWARESSGVDAFVALAEWLASHRTMFSDKCDDRQLAFDASRGIFLPACIRAFDGKGGPRLTRGSIPLRNSAQQSVRTTQPSQHPPAAPSQTAATANSAHGQGTTAQSTSAYASGSAQNSKPAASSSHMSLKTEPESKMEVHATFQALQAQHQAQQSQQSQQPHQVHAQELAQRMVAEQNMRAQAAAAAQLQQAQGPPVSRASSSVSRRTR